MLRTAFSGPFRGVCFAAGLWWAAAGTVFLAAAIGSFAAKRKGTFPRSGVYALCRRPFSAWLSLFALPAAALLLDDALFAAAAALSFVALSRRARTADDRLSAAFGAPYRDYAVRTRALLPVPRKIRSIGALVRTLALPAAAAGILSAAFLLWAILPIMSGFGASSRELNRRWSGDEWTGPRGSGFTQAATIAAPPDRVWPWVVQVGYRRAGWYNFDAVNRLAAPDYFYEGGGSARRIVTELQDLKTGDSIALAPGLEFRVSELEARRRLLLAAGTEAGGDAVSWLFELSPAGDGGTRIVSRFRSAPKERPGAADRAFAFLAAVGGTILQQPAMFHGLAVRAESRLR